MCNGVVFFTMKMTDITIAFCLFRATWYTSIREVLGEDFYLNDALRTQHTNLQDLYAHRLGIPGHNPIRIAGYTLGELVR